MKESEIPRFIRKLLTLRGIKDEEAIRRFLYPQLTSLPHPEQMLNLREAAETVCRFMREKLQIVIWGDYDVDGTTATSLLVNFFRTLGVEVLWHIPNRLTDGYGLNSAWFEENTGSFSSRRFLLITVDNGISSRKEVERIKELGGVVVVTDHHAIPVEGIPDCTVVNPEQEGCGFQAEKVAGVGIAFYLASAIRSLMSKSNEVNMKSFLPFVAIGTVADMVPLTETNRILVRAGFEALEQTEFVGLQALLSQSEIFSGRLTSEDIGFSIAPKINAAGRLGNSTLVVELLTATEKRSAVKKSRQLAALNEERKELCRESFQLAESLVSSWNVEEEKICIVAGDFHPGIAGIVASKLVERFGVPAIVLAEVAGSHGKTILRGSGRSIEGVNLHEVLTRCAEHLKSYGGHVMAVGLSLLPDELRTFRNQAGEEVRRQLESPERSTIRTKSYDVSCSMDEVMQPQALDWLNRMEPFGQGNPLPRFYDENGIITQSRKVGADRQHLTMMFRGRYAQYKGIGFNLGSQLNEVQERTQQKVVYSLTRNRYRGTESWQIRVLSLH